MNKEQFLTELQDVLQRDDPVLENDVLADYDEWDSLSKMAIMAFFGKEFAQLITFDDIVYSNTIGDLLELAKEHISD